MGVGCRWGVGWGGVCLFLCHILSWILTRTVEWVVRCSSPGVLTRQVHQDWRVRIKYPFKTLKKKNRKWKEVNLCKGPYSESLLNGHFSRACFRASLERFDDFQRYWEFNSAQPSESFSAPPDPLHEQMRPHPQPGGVSLKLNKMHLFNLIT